MKLAVKSWCRRGLFALLCAPAYMAGCVQPGYQYTQPAGFSSTHQRYVMERQQMLMQPMAAKPAEAPNAASSQAAAVSQLPSAR